ncbi:hypothetical protein F4780DRAFT_479255 [Xylariomycetidae sp. FL0641]|nr:hypothetical protein F4780DRAFT_479255 [Xylariomycetidae sp. FL0641]
MPEDETAAEGSSGAQAGESLSCVTCRNRKLKCDRVKPTCARCAKSDSECVYPESRRKPAVKRRNVKELEARLAQVEELLKDSGDGKASGVKLPTEPAVEPINPQMFDVPMTEDVFLQGMDYSEPNFLYGGNAEFTFTQGNQPSFSTGDPNASTYPRDNGAFQGELMDLGGIFETLPPFEIMEDLNRIFFERQQQFIPIIHPARYIQSFYSPPHMKPPMCLQYAIWAMASNGHPKYRSYHDVFYRRARQYAESDEMKAYGEHFITVRHAQAWCLIATDEAKAMMFTRAAMSCARGVRLAEMLGLHRLDGPEDEFPEISPTLLPPKDWAELEERRRAYWGIFCIDSHAAISTGWPHLIDVNDITTHLPATESAFHTGEPMETCTIHDAFKGHSYSSFAGAILICHLFNQILKHVHRPKPNDHPENYEYGEFWQRHREIDNTLTSAFMFLPESFRLPDSYRDQTAVHTNLNLHASTICLHHAALDKIEGHGLPDSAKQDSQNRLRTAAQEIVNIMKLTSHLSMNPKSPLAALSLYCAASVYVYLCQGNAAPAPAHVGNLDFILAAMEAIGREHTITRAFLRQIVLDIERNGIQHLVRVPQYAAGGSTGNSAAAAAPLTSHNIPLLARSKVSRHSGGAQPVLPGRLPLGNPVGNVVATTADDADADEERVGWACPYNSSHHPQPSAFGDATTSSSSGPPPPPTNHNNNHKRRRTSTASPAATATTGTEPQQQQSSSSSSSAASWGFQAASACASSSSPAENHHHHHHQQQHPPLLLHNGPQSTYFPGAAAMPQIVRRGGGGGGGGVKLAHRAGTSSPGATTSTHNTATTSSSSSGNTGNGNGTANPSFGTNPPRWGGLLNLVNLADVGGGAAAAAAEPFAFLGPDDLDAVDWDALRAGLDGGAGGAVGTGDGGAGVG